MGAADMTTRKVRDLLGDPSSWQNYVNDGDETAMPDMAGAIIVDAFCNGNQLSVYTRNDVGLEALSIFFVEDLGLCAQIAEVLKPGSDVHEALASSIG
jgi:hypothetical protein